MNENEGRDLSRERLSSGRAGHLLQPQCLLTRGREIAASCCPLPLCRGLEEIAEVTDKTVMVCFQPVRRVERSNGLFALLKDIECIQTDGIDDLQDLLFVEGRAAGPRR